MSSLGFGCRKSKTRTGKVDRYRMNRGDKTAIELFLAGVRGWEAGLRRFLAPSADEK
jgi:hypothetical protein